MPSIVLLESARIISPAALKSSHCIRHLIFPINLRIYHQRFSHTHATRHSAHQRPHSTAPPLFRKPAQSQTQIPHTIRKHKTTTARTTIGSLPVYAPPIPCMRAPRSHLNGQSPAGNTHGRYFSPHIYTHARQRSAALGTPNLGWNV